MDDNNANDSKLSLQMRNNDNSLPLINYFNPNKQTPIDGPGKVNEINSFTLPKKDSKPTQQNEKNLNKTQGAQVGTQIEKTTQNPLSNFLKELELFESAEWSLIELLEEIETPLNRPYITTYELFTILSKKYSPTIQKDKLYGCVSLMDGNKDGYVSLLDLITFLLNYLKHRSAKLGWKELARKIEYDDLISTEEYFSKARMSNSDEVTFAIFAKTIIKDFQIEPPVVKTMYEELKKIFSNTTKTKIIVADLIDIINGYQENSKLKAKEANSLMMSTSKKKEINPISLLDKKFYEEEMKNFLSFLQKAFMENVISASIDEIKESFKSTLSSFLCLPQSMRLDTFREVFIKPLSMDYALGISTFLLLKSFAMKEESLIAKEDLLNLLTSYMDLTKIYPPDPGVIVYLIETSQWFPNLKFCFEAIPYNYKGITVYDLVKYLEVFYPKISKGILLNLVKAIDSNLKGIVNYKNLCDCLFKYSKNDAMSANLMIKHLASILDLKKSDTMKFIKEEFLTIISRSKKKHSVQQITHEDHDEFFINNLKFTPEQSDCLFLLLTNLQDGYTITRLCREVNHFRGVNRYSVSPGQVFDNTHEVENPKTHSKLFTEFLRILNDNVSLSESMKTLTMNSELEIAVNEIFLVFVRIYSSIFDLDRTILLKLLQFIDKDKKGMIPYEHLIKAIKSHLNEFEPSPVLHLQYVANKIFKDFEGKWREYLSFKKIIGNMYLPQDQFSKLFKLEECLNDETIVHEVFEFLKEKKGNNANMVYVQNFIDYLASVVNLRERKTISNVDSMAPLTDDQCEKLIKSAIMSVEKEKNVIFSQFFDKIKLELNVNSYGKINSEIIKNLLKELYFFDETTINAFETYFCKVPLLFDLLKLVDVTQQYSKIQIPLDEIILKISKAIPRNKTTSLFAKTYNLNFSLPLTLVECCCFLKPVFNLTTFESFLLFMNLVGRESNPQKKALKVSFNYIFSELDLMKYFLKEENNQVKNKTVEPSILLALKIFASYLRKVPNQQQFYASFDIDNDGCLTREEFMSMIDSCKIKNLNQASKIKILNYIDTNNNDNIDYKEFSNFISTMDIDTHQDDTQQKPEPEPIVKSEPKKLEPTQNAKKPFKSQIDIDKLRGSYSFNSKNKEKLNPNEKIILGIQANIIDSINTNKCIETILYEKDNNSSGALAKAMVFQVINDVIKVKLTPENEEFLFNFSMDNLTSKRKTQLISQNMINYMNFLSNISLFKIKERTEKIELNPAQKEFANIVNINKKVDEKWKQRNQSFAEYLKNKIGKNYDFNKEEDIVQIKNVLLQTFSFQGTTNDKKIEDPNLGYFKQFIKEVITQEYLGYNYTLISEDYFQRLDGTPVKTILNNEDAAIKKCEELYNSLKPNEDFWDPDFGSQPNDNFGEKNKSSFYFGAVPKGQLDPKLLEWYRMNEISDSPVFIDDSAEANDVMQGALGDCWFISALSVLVTKDHLLRGEFNEKIVEDGIIDNEESVMLSTGVYPPIFHGFRKKKIFCFRFYKNFKWRYVIIDDRLPCQKVFSKNQTPKIVYGKCRNENEFWVPLIEKAYAKLHGCYEALISGFIDDGLADLTGLVSRKLLLEDSLLNTPEKVNELWELMKKFNSEYFADVGEMKGKDNKVLKSHLLTMNNTMMGCSIDSNVVQQEVVYNGNQCGILAGHAYSILDLIEIPKPTSAKSRKMSRLMRIRNPWGFKEWNGKWSDESEEMEKSKELINRALLNKNKFSDEHVDLLAEDGTFLMCYKDFRTLFNKLFISIDFSPKYVGLYFEDRWTKEESGGLPVNNTDSEFLSWAANPQYFMSLKKDTYFYANLLQEDGRLTGTKFPFSGFTKKTCLIVSPAKGKKQFSSFAEANPIHISPVRTHRENSIHIQLPAGEYIISCCIFEKGQTANFRLDIFVEDSFTSGDYNESNFMQYLVNTKIERLGNTYVKPCMIQEMTIEEIQNVKTRKRQFILHQIKLMLESENVEDKREEKKKQNEIGDEF